MDVDQLKLVFFPCGQINKILKNNPLFHLFFFSKSYMIRARRKNESKKKDKQGTSAIKYQSVFTINQSWWFKIGTLFCLGF